jgi:hypothetical protein
MGATAKKAERLARVRVSEIVQYGEGQGSRIDLTIEVSGRRVRLTRLRASDTMSYRKIRQKAIQQRTALPFFRDGDEVWSEAFCAAMKRARFEPLLEGEDVAEAIAAEIVALLKLRERGRDAADLKAGKVIKRRDQERKPCLVMSPDVVAEHVRRRLVDDVLPRATIVEAAKSLLGMRGMRPHFPDARPGGWAFPLPLPATRELDELEATSTSAASPMSLNVGVRVGSNGSTSGSTHGSLVEKPISHIDNEMRSGSNGSTDFMAAPATVLGRRAEQAVSAVEPVNVNDESEARSGVKPGEPAKPGKFDSSKISGKTEPRALSRAAELKE